MKIIRNLTMAGCSVLLLSQCATQDEVRALNYQLRAVNQKVEDVKSNAVNKMQKRQASSVNKIDQVESETMRLKSMIEENAHQASLQREQSKEDLANLQAMIESMAAENSTRQLELRQQVTLLEQQLARLSGNLERLQQLKVREAEQRAREAARRAELAKRQTVVAAASGSSGLARVLPLEKKVRVGSARVVDGAGSTSKPSTQVQAATGTTSPKPSVETVITPDETAGPFAKAMQQFQAKKYQQAYGELEQVLAGNPQGKRAAETLFYMGECLFFQGEYDLAILDYQKVISNHRRDSLAPQALLKQGMSFEKLTDLETAKIIYKKLISEYSSSSEASQAKSRLANL
ncbi:tetratricopeptide repeat protein [Desulfogranum mediterraneum]|uniref:tetratricopeptide repeat protein n=1 Tax=Desulfogranum mediterraneum TaxID=160661 RepID=UPI0004219A88|nr:tetratricopeptide repeat protein [Desulfogranum mediterraneum]